MKNLGKMMQQAQQMQAKMAEMRTALDSMEVEGQSGGGMVTVTMTGKHEVRAVRIDPSLISPEDAEVLEDLIAAACNEASGKVEDMMREKVKEMTGGLELPPGMSLPF